MALAVLLAAATDRTRTLDQLLHWTRAYPGGVVALLPPPTAPPPVPHKATLRQTKRSNQRMRERQADQLCRPLFVERCVAGRVWAADLTRAEQDQTIRILHARGMSDAAIADRMGSSRDLVRYRRDTLDLPGNPQQQEAERA
jgi:hypothetical protein